MTMMKLQKILEKILAILILVNCQDILNPMIVMDKLEILEQQNNDYKKLVEDLIKQQEQQGNNLMEYEQSLIAIEQQNIEHNKSLGIVITQQQNIKQNLNTKFNSLTNKINNIQLVLKQS
eukprot:501561_1